MRAITWKIGLSAPLLALMLVLTACGGGESEPAGAEAEGQGSVEADADAEAEVEPGVLGESWDEVVARAKAEGKVVFYTGRPGFPEPLVAAFSEQYPEIEVEHLREGDGDLRTRIEQERTQDLDGADVSFLVFTDWHEERSAAGEFLTLTEPLGPSAGNWTDSELFNEDWATIYTLVMGLAYNSELTSEPVEDHADLLRPEFEGNVAALELVAPAIYGYYDWIEQQHDGWLEGFADQSPTLFPSSVPISQGLAAGEFAASQYATKGVIQQMIDEGAPVVFVPTDFSVAYTVAAHGWSERPNAALLFADFMLSEEAARIMHGIDPGGSPVYEVEGSSPVSPPDVWPATEYTADVLAEREQRWLEIMVGG